MAQTSPIAFQEVLQLTKLGVDPAHIKFVNVTIQSAKYVCVRQEGKNNVAIIDTATKNMLRLPVPVDSAIMNPISKVVGLRAVANGVANLQIYNLELRTKMKSATVPGTVVFWRWLDPKTVAIVTDASVYHWSMDGDAQPEKIFDRSASNGPVQVINYRSSADGKWLIVVGIAAQLTGVLQVYSVEKRMSQPTMDSHAACFSTITLDGNSAPSNLLCFTKIQGSNAKLTVIEVGKAPDSKPFSRSAQINLQQGDFPVSMVPDDKYGLVFLVTKRGFVFLYDVQSGKCLFGERASPVTMFASIEHGGPEGGMVGVDQQGKVSHFYVDQKNIVPYICGQMNDLDLGVKFAKRHNLPGADGIFRQQFTRLIQAQQYPQAMELAATSPQGVLRTIETINALKQVNQGNGLLQYFQLLLKNGSLNEVESIELAKPVLAKPQGIEHIKGWLKDQKLQPSEDLGELLKNHDVTLALSVYLRAKCPDKVISCFLSLGAQEQNDAKAHEYFSNIKAYAKRVNFTPDYPMLVQQLIMVNRDRAKDFALLLLTGEEGALIDIRNTIASFMQSGDVKNTTNILLEYLKPRGDLPEDADLQTKLLEINLLQKPQVADAIMESDEYQLSHYDRVKVAQLCERAQLFQRALEHYTELSDFKRILSTYSHALKPEFLLEFFGRMTNEDCLECLRDQLKYSVQKNIRLVVEVAKKWNDTLGSEALIELFEEFDSPHTLNGLYFYLGSFVNSTEDPVIVFKYIEAATKLNQLKEVERVCRDNEHYEAKEVKEYLLQQNLKDPRPLIHVCDRFGFVDELTRYLYNNELYMFIEAYVQRMNPKSAPKVVGTLLDLNADDSKVTKLMSAVRPPTDSPEYIKDLCDEVGKRGRLKLLRSWFEDRASEGSEDVHLHNGLAMIYVDINNNASQFLTTNKFYDSAVVGKYCESRDPHLSFIAYKRSWGECDDALIEVTNRNGFFKDQARYLVERQDLDLWARVLDENNTFRRQLIDQVVATALPESKDPEEVSLTVKGFMAANLPRELIELLERIVLHGPPDGQFATNRHLQNLLILTAIKADKERVMDYIKRLDNYDGPDVAKIAISDQFKLYEEAFYIYKKFEKGPECIQVLLENMEDMARAQAFAEYWDKSDVWSILAKAQLEKGLIKESIEAFLKADDAALFAAVTDAAKADSLYEELIEYLKMCRSKLKDHIIDNELIYAYAKVDRLSDLEELISGSHVAKIQDVADSCFDEGLYQAARILYNHVNNNAKLAICLVKLEQFQEAVDAARKANAIPTWKAVCFSCVDHKKFRLAQMAGLNIIVHMDHLTDLCRHYETAGHFQEVITLLEQGINLDRAHQGIFTNLGILYAKYKEEQLMDHIKLWWGKLNISQLLVSCQQNLHWPETVFLYTHYEQHENAVDVMMSQSAACWKHDLFKEILGKVSNTEVYYRAMEFYLRENPMLLNDLLLDLSAQLDHSRVVSKVRLSDNLPLVQKYLLHVQRENLQAVNEAINQMAIESEDYKALRSSINDYDRYDQIALAQSIESHELLEFRRIAAFIYKKNKRWDRSVRLSKQDGLWQDAMETTADSGNSKLAEELIYFFVDQKNDACVGACLFTCYTLIRPDVVIEVAWRFKLFDYAMPFIIQAVRDFGEKVEGIEHKINSKDEKEKEEEEKLKKAEIDQTKESAAILGTGYNPMMAPLALTAPPVMGGGMGVGMGGPGMYGVPPQMQNPQMGMGGFQQQQTPFY